MLLCAAPRDAEAVDALDVGAHHRNDPLISQACINEGLDGFSVPEEAVVRAAPALRLDVPSLPGIPESSALEARGHVVLVAEVEHVRAEGTVQKIQVPILIRLERRREVPTGAEERQDGNSGRSAELDGLLLRPSGREGRQGQLAAEHGVRSAYESNVRAREQLIDAEDRLKRHFLRLCVPYFADPRRQRLGPLFHADVVRPRGRSQGLLTHWSAGNLRRRLAKCRRALDHHAVVPLGMLQNRHIGVALDEVPKHAAL
mmetsp:Transcript_8831/g.33346  ORF Transcript_8831/g.33346 Transcript_8831/m.33346 type:complete len:258 (+) Transcript_8831:1764-2537(+)